MDPSRLLRPLCSWCANSPCALPFRRCHSYLERVHRLSSEFVRRELALPPSSLECTGSTSNAEARPLHNLRSNSGKLHSRCRTGIDGHDSSRAVGVDVDGSRSGDCISSNLAGCSKMGNRYPLHRRRLVSITRASSVASRNGRVGMHMASPWRALLHRRRSRLQSPPPESDSRGLWLSRSVPLGHLLRGSLSLHRHPLFCPPRGRSQVTDMRGVR